MGSDQDYHIEKLIDYGYQFRRLYGQGEYTKAKYLYDTALRVAAFLEVPKEVKKILFGITEEWEEDAEGLFDQKMTAKCYKEACIKHYQEYEFESYRRYGEPPRYYPVPRYPVKGYPPQVLRARRRVKRK